jgi:hypothetical protein
MNTPMLFDMPETIRRPKWDDKVLSLSGDEKQIIRWILDLYNAGQPVDVDPCYSVGRFWEGLPKPKHKYDINPQAEGVEMANARDLPLPANSVTSVMFDPPFVVAPSPKPGIIRDRFACYPTVKKLWEFYGEALREFHRILVTGGLLIFKCQDFVSGGKQHLSHIAVVNMAERAGFYCDDLFVLHRPNVLWSPNMENQKHARKTHSYFLVFRKSSS